MTQLQSATPAWPTITDGNKNTGSVINKTVIWDPIRDAINGLIHSTTNPTVAPNAAIDELILARGSKATLKDRLDVITNADGTLKTGILTSVQTEVENARGSQASLDARLDNGLTESGTPIIATAILAGAISMADQVMGAGAKQVGTKQPTALLEATTEALKLGGRLTYDATSYANNTGSLADTGWSYSIDAGALTVGNVLLFLVAGTNSGSQNVQRRFYLDFGGTDVPLVFQQTTNAASGDWFAIGMVLISGASAQIMAGMGWINSTTVITLPDVVTAAVAISGVITVKTEVNTGSASETITQTMISVLVF